MAISPLQGPRDKVKGMQILWSVPWGSSTKRGRSGVKPEELQSPLDFRGVCVCLSGERVLLCALC